MHQQLDQQGRDGRGSQQFQADAYIPHIHQHARLRFIPPHATGHQPRIPLLYHSMPSGSHVQQAYPPWPLHYQTIALSSAPGHQHTPFPRLDFNVSNGLHMPTNNGPVNQQHQSALHHNFPRLPPPSSPSGEENPFAYFVPQRGNLPFENVNGSQLSFDSFQPFHPSRQAGDFCPDTKPAPNVFQQKEHRDAEPYLTVGNEWVADDVVGDSWKADNFDKLEVQHLPSRQASQPDIHRFGDRMPTFSSCASTNVDTGRKIQCNLQHGAQQANLDKDLPRYPHLTTCDEHRSRHATEGVSIHKSEDRSSRSNKENWSDSKPDHGNRRNRSSRDNQAPEKKNKDHLAIRASCSRSNKHWTKERDTLESLLTEVKEEKHIEGKKRSRKSVSPHRRRRRCSRSKSRERQDISYGRWDRSVAAARHNSYIGKCSASRLTGRLFKESTPSHSYTSRRRDRDSDRKSRREEVMLNRRKSEHAPSAQSGGKAKVSSCEAIEEEEEEEEEGEIISRASTPYSPPGYLPGDEEEEEEEEEEEAHSVDVLADMPIAEEEDVTNVDWQMFALDVGWPASPVAQLAAPASPEEVSTLEASSSSGKCLADGRVCHMTGACCSTDYDQIDLGAPLSPDADESVLYSPRTAPILLGHPDSPNPSETADRPPFITGIHSINNHDLSLTSIDVDDELEAALQGASRQESLETIQHKLEKEEEDNMLLLDEAEVAENEQCDMLPCVEPEFDGDLDVSVSEIEEDDQMEDMSDGDEEEVDFELPFFPFDITLQTDDDAPERVMFETEDVLRARAMAALGGELLLPAQSEADDSLGPPASAVKDVLRVQMDEDGRGKGGPASLVSFNFGTLLPPATQHAPFDRRSNMTAPSLPDLIGSTLDIKPESPPAVIIALSPSPSPEVTSSHSTAKTSSSRVSPSKTCSSTSFAGGETTESTQQSFFRRMMNQSENVTHITFEASKARIITSASDVVDAKKAHRKAKFGPIEQEENQPTVGKSHRNDSMSDKASFAAAAAAAAVLTKFSTATSPVQVCARSRREKVEISMLISPQSTKHRRKKKRKQGSVAVPSDRLPKSPNGPPTLVLPQGKRIPALQSLANQSSSTRHGDAHRQLDVLECSLEEAYWNDIEMIDKIQKLESDLKVAHRRKMKSEHRIAALHQLVEKAAYIIDADNADDIMDLTNHLPSQEDSSPSSSRGPSPEASSSPPRKRSKLSCPTYLRLPSWAADTTKQSHSTSNIDVHQDPFLKIIRQLKTLGDEKMKETSMADTGTTTEMEGLEGLAPGLIPWTKPEEHATLKSLLQSTALFQLRAGFAGLWSDDPCGLRYVNSVNPTKTYCFCHCPTNCPRSAKCHLRDFCQTETRAKLKEQFDCLSNWITGRNVTLSPAITALLTKVRKCQSRENSGQVRHLWLEMLSDVTQGCFFNVSSEHLSV